MNGGIYIHVPFCRSRCAYCSFYSISTAAFHLDVPEFTAALTAHLDSFGEQESSFTVNSIYFGGGTPSLLPASFFAEFIERLSKRFSFAEKPEITIELNPEDAKPDYLRSLKQAGLNRISIGIQSTDDGILKTLNRTHSVGTAILAVENTMSVFQNVSCDLIIGVKDESEDEERILQPLPLTKLSHLSVYMLDGKKNRWLSEADDHTANLYLKICDFLERSGLIQYEISNFARPGMESVHNLHYWMGDPYIGVGPSAHSFLYPFRIWDHSGLTRFMSGDFKRGEMKYEKEMFVREMVMLGLRLRSGIKHADFSSRFGIDFFREFEWLSNKFPGFVIRDDTGISLSRQGMLLSNEIFQELIR